MHSVAQLGPFEQRWHASESFSLKYHDHGKLGSTFVIVMESKSPFTMEALQQTERLLLASILEVVE